MLKTTIRKSPARSGSWLLCALSLLLQLGAASARAEEFFPEPEDAPTPADADKLYFNGRFQVNDADPLSSVPAVAEQNKYPVDYGNFLMMLVERADLAVKRGDAQSAVRYYLALASGTPQSAIGFRKLCETYQRANMRAEALLSCESVLSREGVTVADSLQYVQLVLSAPEALSAEQVTAVDAVIEHLATQTSDQVVPADLRCRVASRLQDVKRLESCVSQLHALHVSPEQTSVYGWSLAMLHGDRAEAARQLALAERTNIDRSQLARMTNVLKLAQRADAGRYLPQLLAAVLVAALLASGLVMQRRRRTAGDLRGPTA